MKKTILIIFPIILLAIAFGYIIPKVKEKQEQNRYSFELNGLNGKVNFSDFKGKAIAIYFGYTYCPDICPTSLTILSQALNLLSKEELSEVQPIFISVDPERDNLEHLNKYSKYFHSKIIGLTSNAETIREVANRYGTKYERVDLNDSSTMGYSIAHTSFIYIFDKEGKFSSVVQPSIPKELTEKLQKAISK